MTLTETLVCDACRMKLPSAVHAKTHLIVHGTGHEARIVRLDEHNVSH